jgi:hypothetical protein
VAEPVLLIDEPSPFAPRADWLEHSASLAEIVAQYGLTPEIEEMIREADAALNAKAAGSAEF